MEKPNREMKKSVRMGGTYASHNMPKGSFGHVSSLNLERQKFNSGNYNNGQFNQSYHPKVYTDDYRNKTIGFGKKKPISDKQREKDKVLNHLNFWDMLGCGGR